MEEKIACCICKKEFPIITFAHLKTHNFTFSDYMEKFGNKTKIASELTLNKISKKLKGRIFSESHRHKLSIAQSKNILSKETKMKISLYQKNRPKSENTKNNMRKSWREGKGFQSWIKRKDKPYHTYAKGSFYKNHYMRSTWELEFAKFLDVKNIKWEHEPKAFKLENGKRYIPDFYLPELDEFVEIKGWMDKRSSEKIELFKKNYPSIKLKVIKNKKWSEEYE